jgi:hypothetical protein
MKNREAHICPRSDDRQPSHLHLPASNALFSHFSTFWVFLRQAPRLKPLSREQVALFVRCHGQDEIEIRPVVD